MTQLPSDPAVRSSEPDGLSALLAPLEGLEERPVGEHVAAYEQVHAGLRRVLAGEDAAPQG